MFLCTGSNRRFFEFYLREEFATLTQTFTRAALYWAQLVLCQSIFADEDWRSKWLYCMFLFIFMFMGYKKPVSQIEAESVSKTAPGISEPTTYMYFIASLDSDESFGMHWFILLFFKSVSIVFSWGFKIVYYLGQTLVRKIKQRFTTNTAIIPLSQRSICCSIGQKLASVHGGIYFMIPCRMTIAGWKTTNTARHLVL